MYKYLKGKFVLVDERYLTASEIAQQNGLYTPSISGELLPNDLLVSFLIEKFIYESNYKASEYYYVNEGDVAYRVYSPDFAQKIDNIIQDIIKNEGLESNESILVKLDDIPIPFVYYVKQSKIINMSDFKKKRNKEE